MEAVQLEYEKTSEKPFGAQLVLQKLDAELAQLRKAMAKIDPNSKDPSDIWALPIYEKIINRRKKLVEALSQ